MHSVIPFPRRAKPPRACASCAHPLPKLAPVWHRFCRQCYLHQRHYHIVKRIVAEARR